MAIRIGVGQTMDASDLSLGIVKGSRYAELWDTVKGLEIGKALTVEVEDDDGKGMEVVRRRVAAGLKRFMAAKPEDRHYQVRVTKGDNPQVIVVCYPRSENEE
jgi:hypothetical protein